MSRQMVGVIYFTSLGVSPVGRRLATAAPPGWWSSPEPLSKNPSWVASQAEAGLHVSAYSYALNNPVNYVDPDGRLVWTIPIILAVYGTEISAVLLGIGVGVGIGVSQLAPPVVCGPGPSTLRSLRLVA